MKKFYNLGACMKPDIYSFENSVEPDELASKTADQDPTNTVFCTIK